MKRTIILIVFSLLASCLSAQDLTNVQKRRMNYLALELLEDYELYSTLTDKAARSKFIKLFSSPEDKIFCDLYNDGHNYLGQVSVTEYVNFIQKNCESIYSRVSNIRKGTVRYEGGNWYYTFIFDKDISFNDMNGVLFPVEEYETEPFRLEMLVKFDRNLEDPHICEVRLQSESAPQKARRMIIVQKAETKKDMKKESKVTIDGKPLDYNSFDQALVSSFAFEHPDKDVIISYETLAAETAYDLVMLKFKSNRMRLKLRNEIAPIAYAAVDGQRSDKISSFGYSAGLDLGVTFPLAGKIKAGAFVGIALSHSSLKVSDSFPSYTFTYTDSQGKEMSHMYNGLKVSQRLSFVDLVLPVYLNMESEINDRIGLVADLGVKLYRNSKTVASPPAASFSLAGENCSMTYSGMSGLERVPYEMTFFFNLGADVKLVERRLDLEAKIGYERGGNSVRGKDSISVNDYKMPVIYSDMSDSHVLLAPVLGNATFARNAIWIQLGLNFKF